MKVLVVGSYRADDGTKLDGFKTICRELGRSLARKQHQVILCGTSEATADRYVFEGVNQAGVNAKTIHFGLDLTRASPKRALSAGTFLDTLDSVDLDLRFVEGGPRVVHLSAIREADLVLAIGGSSGTSAVIYSAALLEKPIMVIPMYGGASEDAWPDFRSFYNPEEKNLLQTPSQLSPKWANGFVDTAMDFARRNPFASVKLADTVASTAIGACIAGGWIAALTRVNVGPLSPLAWVYALIVFATYLGVMLRHSLATGRYPWRCRLHDLFQAFIVAFATLVFAEGVNAFVSNSTLPLDQANAQLVGWRLSVVGLSAGLLVDEYYKLVTEKARRYLELLTE